MKICVVSDVLDEENNGTTIAAMNLIRTLKAKGHEVKVVCPETKYHKGEEDFYFVCVADYNVYVCVRCGTGVQLLQTGSEQMAVAQFHGFSGNLF